MDWADTTKGRYNKEPKNFCRNPSKYKGGLWCYFLNEKGVRKWEVCNIPNCYEVCKMSQSPFYNGTENVSTYGNKCLDWRDRRVTQLEGRKRYDHNFCRGPEENRGSSAWSVEYNKQTIERCAIESCPEYIQNSG